MCGTSLIFLTDKSPHTYMLKHCSQLPFSEPPRIYHVTLNFKARSEGDKEVMREQRRTLSRRACWHEPDEGTAHRGQRQGHWAVAQK